MQMRPVRSHRLTLLAAGVLLASPLLGGCGFNYQTDRVNTISAGINDRSGEVDVLGAVIIAGQNDLGVFAATLTGGYDGPAILEGLEPTDDLEQIDAAVGVEVPTAGVANLFETGGIPVAGAFQAGQFVTVTLLFDTGQSTTLEVPVVKPCHQYSPEKLPAITLPESSELTELAETEGDPATDPYSCEGLPPVEHGGEH